MLLRQTFYQLSWLPSPSFVFRITIIWFKWTNECFFCSWLYPKHSFSCFISFSFICCWPQFLLRHMHMFTLIFFLLPIPLSTNLIQFSGAIIFNKSVSWSWVIFFLNTLLLIIIQCHLNSVMGFNIRYEDCFSNLSSDVRLAFHWPLPLLFRIESCLGFYAHELHFLTLLLQGNQFPLGFISFLQLHSRQPSTDSMCYWL